MFKLLSIYLSGSILVGIVTVASTFLLTHALTPASYGEGMLFFSIISFLCFICNPGMDFLFVRYFYEEKYKHNTSLLLYRCLGVTCSFFVVIFIVLSFFRQNFSQLFSGAGVGVFLLIALGVFLFIVWRFSSLIPRLLEQPILYSSGDLIRESCFFIFCVTLICFHKTTFWTIVYGQLVATAVVCVWFISLYKKMWGFPSKVLSGFDTEEVKSFIKYGAPLAITGGLSWLLNNLDRLFLLRWSNYHELGIYTAAFNLASPLVMLQTVFMTAWVPRANQLLIQQPFKAKKIFHDTFNTTLWSLTLGAMVLLLLKNLLVLFLGKEYRGAGDIFVWLLFIPYFFALAEIAQAGLIKSKKTYWNIIIVILSVLGNVLSCYFLIPVLGAQGAAIAIAVSFGIFFIANRAFSFYYYPFKINYLKLFFYIIYLCVAMWLTICDHFYLVLTGLFIFFGLSLFLEKKWLITYFRKLNVKII